MARKKPMVAPANQRALPVGPLFFYRPEHHDHKFLMRYPRRGPFDAALLVGRYVAPYPPGSHHEKRFGYTGRELADSLDSSGAPYVIDPDTPVLAAAGANNLPTPRVGMMPHAQVLPLPLRPMSFAVAADRVAFSQAAAGAQRGAAALVAPYFQFERTGDFWHRLNLELIDDVKASAQGRTLAAFAQVSLDTLVAGELEQAALSYADAGAHRVFVRVSGFAPEEVDARAVRAYRRALDAFGNAGVEAIADCVGRFGLVLVAAGAAGFSSGARYFQSVPEELRYDPGQEMRSDPCLYEVPKRWFAMRKELARQHKHSLPSCPTASCSALDSAADSMDQKEHLIHYFTTETRMHAASGAAAARTSLQRYPSGNSSAWLIAV